MKPHVYGLYPLLRLGKMSQVAYEKSHFSSFHYQLREIELAQSIPVPHNHFTRHPIVKRVHLLNSLIFHNYLATG